MQIHLNRKIMDVNKKIKQGDIKALFPALRMRVVANGCICEIITVSEQQVKCEVIEPFNSGYKIGSQFWVTNFLINE